MKKLMLLLLLVAACGGRDEPTGFTLVDPTGAWITCDRVSYTRGCGMNASVCSDARTYTCLRDIVVLWGKYGSTLQEFPDIGLPDFHATTLEKK